MDDPWEMIDAAGASADPVERRQLLNGALSLLDKTDAAASEVMVARATVLALLAGEGVETFDSAEAACRLAEEMGRDPHWAYLHLAYGYLNHDKPLDALRNAEKIPDGFFDMQGVHWRAYSLLEVRATGLLLLGKTEAAERVSALLAIDLRDRGVSDDLPPPSVLVSAALKLAKSSDQSLANVGRRIAELILDAAPDPGQSWIPPEWLSSMRRELNSLKADK